ncbi:MAG: translation elongation factor Ts [Clostridium sp.]|nr:translation elongation factor Ts [Clostridium sp.]
MITAKMVKDLREKTGAGMMDCKKALTESNGDEEKAVEYLREKGLAAAAKKSGRIAAEGLVTTYISADNKTAVVLEVNCETDFVAVNEGFVNFTNNVAKQIATTNVTTLDELLEAKFIEDATMTVKDALTALIAKLGENMNVRRFEKVEVANGAINSYIHGEGKIGVLVKLECANESNVLLEVAKDIAMQVAATNPLFLDENSVDQEAINKEREIYRVQALNEGKSEKIVDKMVEGRVQKYLKEVCLIDQVWVKNSDYTIKQLLEQKSKEVGAPITLSQFVRFERGEGIEKKEENFAEEVQKQMKK